MDLSVLLLDPGDLVDHSVPPLVHALVADVHLRIQYPQEAETVLGQLLNRNAHDLLVAHRAVVQVELVV